MSNRRQNEHQPSTLLRRIGGNLLIVLITTMVTAFALVSTVLSVVTFPTVLIVAFLIYGFSSSLLLFFLFSTTVTAVSLLLGFIPILGPALYWFIAKDLLISAFQGGGLEPNVLITLVAWSGLAISIGKNIGRLLDPKVTAPIARFLKRFGKQTSGRQEWSQQDLATQNLARQSFARASEEFCLRHIPAIFTHWSKAELQALEFNRSELETGSNGLGVGVDSLKRSAKRFKDTLDSLEVYRSKLGRIKVEQNKACMELIRRDTPRFFIGRETYTAKLTYEVTFEKEMRNATILKSVPVKIVTICHRSHIRLLTLSLDETAL